MKSIRVTAIPTTVTVGGKRYGPFRAGKQKPYTEVPQQIATALGLPEYSGPEVATEHVQLTATGDAPSGGTPLPADFPEREHLVGTYPTLEALRGASAADLEALPKIGKAKTKAVQDALKAQE